MICISLFLPCLMQQICLHFCVKMRIIGGTKMKYTYTAVFAEKDGKVYARVPDLNGYITTGKDLSDAIEQMADAMAAWRKTRACRFRSQRNRRKSLAEMTRNFRSSMPTPCNTARRPPRSRFCFFRKKYAK